MQRRFKLFLMILFFLSISSLTFAVEKQKKPSKSPYSICNRPTEEQKNVIQKLSKKIGMINSKEACTVLMRRLPTLQFVTPEERKILKKKSNVKIYENIVMLGYEWGPEVDIKGWQMSEKLDGVRTRWTGSELISRSGRNFHAPKWFIKGFPSIPLDGELWLERGRFEDTISIVATQSTKTDWKKLKFLVFDAPHQAGGFEGRLEQAKEKIRESSSKYISLIEHKTCLGYKHLQESLVKVEAVKGEGLMLRSPNSPYIKGRSRYMLKVKSFHDAEAIVIAYLPGKGKYTGMMGSIQVELSNGKRFAIGTGFSDDERDQPPPIGSNITFKHHGLTKNGIPRFASYIGIRKDL